MSQEILVLQGLPASGKSTYAKSFCEKHLDYVRVNRDDLRSMCGKYWVPPRESFITSLEQFAVNKALEHGFSVVIDATNLNPKYSNWIDKIALEHGCEARKMFFDVDVEECIRRDKSRENPVSEAVIRRMYEQHIKGNEDKFKT